MVRVGLCVKKGQKSYISRMCREVPRVPFATKIYTCINDTDVITCAKFGDNRFTNFVFTESRMFKRFRSAIPKTTNRNLY